MFSPLSCHCLLFALSLTLQQILIYLLFLPSFYFLSPIENFQIPSVPVLQSHCYSLYSSPYSAMRVSGTTLKTRDCVWQLELVPVSIPHAKMLINGKFGVRSPMRMTYCVTQLSKQKQCILLSTSDLRMMELKILIPKLNSERVRKLLFLRSV